MSPLLKPTLFWFSYFLLLKIAFSEEIKIIENPKILIEDFENINKKTNSKNIKSEEILGTQSPFDCTSLFTCFECASKNECFWCKTTNKCEQYQSSSCNVDLKYYVMNPESSDYWFLNFYYMCNQLSKCGKETFDLSSDKIEVSLNNNFNTYEGCFWEIDNPLKSNYSYSLERQGSGKDKIAMANFQNSIYYVYQFDKNLENYINVTDESYYIKYIFYQYFGEYNKNKFSYSFLSYENCKMSVFMICVIVISSILGALIILLTIRCVYLNCCRTFRISSDVDENSEDEGNSNNIEDIIANLKEVNLENCKATKQNECTICLLPLDCKEKTVALPCHHFFHFDCVNNWIRTKSRKPTCPNCNFDLFSKQQVQIPRGFFANENQIHEEKNNNLSDNLLNNGELAQNAPIFIGENVNNNQNLNRIDPPENSFINDSNLDNNSSKQELGLQQKQKNEIKKIVIIDNKKK